MHLAQGSEMGMQRYGAQSRSLGSTHASRCGMMERDICWQVESFPGSHLRTRRDLAQLPGTKAGTGTQEHPTALPTAASYALPGSVALPGVTSGLAATLLSSSRHSALRKLTRCVS